MKKSQMLKSIETVLNNLTYVGMSNKLKAESILTEIENKGMIPPATKYVSKTMVDGVMHEDVVTGNEWDGE